MCVLVSVSRPSAGGCAGAASVSVAGEGAEGEAAVVVLAEIGVPALFVCVWVYVLPIGTTPTGERGGSVRALSNASLYEWVDVFGEGGGGPTAGGGGGVVVLLCVCVCVWGCVFGGASPSECGKGCVC